MKKAILTGFAALISSTLCLSQSNDNFVPLFNGKDLTGWTLEKTGGFEVADNGLTTRSFGAGNDIYSNNLYGNFILRLEFLLSDVGNSGVFIRCKPSDAGAGFEVQLLAPWTPWRDDLHCTGSLYGYVAVTDRPDETTGKWYKMEIKCDRNIITVSVNGKVTTMANTDTVKTMAGKPYTGVIGFQGNHAEKQGQYAKFRNIYIRDLDAEPDYVLNGFYEKNEKLRRLSCVAAVNLGTPIINRLADMMAGENPVARNGARQVLFDIVAKVSDPTVSKKEKKEVSASLKKTLKNSSSDITRNYLKWLSGMLKI